MPDLKEYSIVINGAEHTVQLNTDDAKRAGVTAVPVKRETVANKAAVPQNK